MKHLISSSFVFLLLSGSPSLHAELDGFKQMRQVQCRHYAKTAVKQNIENKDRSCGFIGARWNNNLQGQLAWCMTVRDVVTNRETQFRDKSLINCKKANVISPQNRPSIPAACFDPKKQYFAVKKIDHHFAYTNGPKSPVNGGVIRYDYNQDKQDDYVFLELKKDDARVTMCFSNVKGYKRRITDITFYAPGSGTMGAATFDISQKKDLLKVTSKRYEHNIGSSTRNTSYRYQPSTKKFKIISNDTDIHSADPENYGEMATPETPILF